MHEKYVEIVKNKLINIGINPEMKMIDWEDKEHIKFLATCDRHFEYMFVPKDEFIRNYNSMMESELGYSQEDKELWLSGKFTIRLNNYASWMSIQEDIKHLGNKSTVYGIDTPEKFKIYQQQKFEDISNCFI